MNTRQIKRYNVHAYMSAPMPNMTRKLPGDRFVQDQQVTCRSGELLPGDTLVQSVVDLQTLEGDREGGRAGGRPQRQSPGLENDHIK